MLMFLIFNFYLKFNFLYFISEYAPNAVIPIPNIIPIVSPVFGNILLDVE